MIGLTRVLASVLLGAVWATSVVGQTTGPFLPENHAPWSYVAPPFEGHCLQTYRLFLPQAPNVMPETGWPVVVQIQLSGYHRSPDVDQLDPASFLAAFLRRGIAVVVARATPSIEMDDPLWEEWCGDNGPDIPGHGLFHPPGVVPSDLAPQALAPYDDPRYHMAEKDAVMLMQHVRFLAKQTANLATDQQQKMALLDHRLIGAHGVSAGGTVLMWPTLGPERRDELPFAGLPGQYAESARPDVAAFIGCPVWWPVFHPNLRPHVNHYGFQGHSEIAAPSMGTASLEELVEASPLYYQDLDAIEGLPLYFMYWEKSVSDQYDRDVANCGSLPFCYPGQGLEGIKGPGVDFEHIHPAWSGYTWKKEHPDTRLGIVDAEAFAQSNGVDAVPFFGQPDSKAQADADVVAWFEAEFADIRAGFSDPEDLIHDVGHGLAGARGVPVLKGEGTMLPNTPMSFTLENCRENADLVLFGGFASIYAPLAGGVIVPNPERVLLFYQSDAAGGLFVPTMWPSGYPSGTTWYVQAFIEDHAAPDRFAISNALELRVP